MNVRSQLIRLAAAGFFAVAAAAAFTKPASAATVDYTGFDQNGTPTLVDTIVTGSNPVLISIQLLPQVTVTAVDGGLYGTISVDVGTPPVIFVADGLPFADPTNLEVGFPGSGIFTALLAANGSYDLVVTALLTLIDAVYVDAGPILRVTTEEVASAVPVPGALPLFATGIGALGLVHWRRKRRAQAA